jgi:hypothetical protein
MPDYSKLNYTEITSLKDLIRAEQKIFDIDEIIVYADATENDSLKKICIDPLPDIPFPTLSSLQELINKIYQIPGKYLKDFELDFPDLPGLPNPLFDDLKFPSLEAHLKISAIFSNLPLKIIELLLSKLQEIIDKVNALLEDAGISLLNLNVFDLIPKPLIRIGNLEFNFQDFLPPIDPTALTDKIKELMQDLTSVFSIPLNKLLGDSSLADIIGRNFRIPRLNLRLSDIRLTEIEIPDLTGKLVKLGTITVSQFLELINNLDFSNLEFRSFKLPELGIPRFSIRSLISKIKIPSELKKAQEIIEDIFDLIERIGFDIAGLTKSFKLFDSVEIPSLRIHLIVQSIQTEIAKLMMNFMEEIISKILEKLEDLSLGNLKLLLPKIPTVSDIYQLIISELSEDVAEARRQIEEAIDKLRNLKIGPFSLFDIPDPLIPGFKLPEFELKFSIMNMASDLAQFKLKLINKLIEDITKLVGLKLKLPGLKELFNFSVVCVIVPGFVINQLLISDSEGKTINIEEEPDEEQTNIPSEGVLITEYGVLNR